MISKGERNMPFKSNVDLVKSVPVTEKLSPKKQNQFREVWNSCHKKGQPESQCFSTAWGVVKKSSDGEIICPAESEGSIGDAMINKDLLDGKIIARELFSIARELGGIDER
jgi:cation transport regulator ChaB